MISFKKNILSTLKFIYVSSILFLIIGSVSYAITGVIWPKQTGDLLTAMTVNELRTWGVNGATFTNDADATGNDIFHMGNVGIGTTSPVHKLHVVGITKLAGVLSVGTSSQSARVETNDGVAYHGSDSSDVKVRIVTDTSNNYNTSKGLTVLDSGSVGIGTKNPSVGLTLDVEGKVGATEYCDQNGDNCKVITNIGGLSGYEIRTASQTSSGHFTVTVDCSSGKIILGGGCNQGTADNRAIVSSAPNTSGNGWFCRVRDVNTSESVEATAYAICANP